MILEFTKMNGAGNDFVLIDNREGKIRLNAGQITRLCDRHRGVGADGVILLTKCVSQKADWAWDFYNSDGSAADMCGNGARCFARFVQRLTGAKKSLTFETRAGVINAVFQKDRVSIGLTPPKDLRLKDKIKVAGQYLVVNSLNTGVPHCVVFVPEILDQIPVEEWGPEIRFHKHYAPKGANVNFAQIEGRGTIRVRTYERGVEGETLACGTGVTASALVASELCHFPSPIKVRVKSGDTLEVSFEKVGGQFANVRLTGPADFVFDGKMIM